MILDGAADLARPEGKSPLQHAHMPHIDYLTRTGVSGFMQTLYNDLPKGSIVAQLGILGYDPHRYYPSGRASCEALAIDVTLNDNDIAFRANLAHVKNNVLHSYNAGYIKSSDAMPLIEMVQQELAEKFPNFELYHNSDFRNTLVIRNTGIHPLRLACLEPHEHTGEKINLSRVVVGRDQKAEKIAAQLNAYIIQTADILKNEQANIILPWSPSSPLRIPRFMLADQGKCGIITHMDFLIGIAKAAGLDYFKMGNGSWDTDYTQKGTKLIELLSHGYGFVYCHINAPDEASHMGDIEKKIFSIEQIDQHIISQIKKYFEDNPKELGGVIVTTDHYTNTFPIKKGEKRVESHSSHPVPFVLWNHTDQDGTTRFSEEDVRKGTYANPPINHTDLLDLFR